LQIEGREMKGKGRRLKKKARNNEGIKKRDYLDKYARRL
jgi:hypothetical protein